MAVLRWINVHRNTAANFNGSVAITLTATDPSAASVSQAFTLAINPVNDAPVVATPVASQSVNEDTAWSYTLPAGLFADPDGDSLTLTATLSDGSPLPSWLTFDGSTFTGTPPANFNGSVASPDGDRSLSRIRLPGLHADRQSR